MALRHEPTLGDPARSNEPDPIERIYRERDTGRSNFVAYVLGGAVIAGAMLTFLYYDSGTPPRGDVMSTGSVGRSVPAPMPGQAPVRNTQDAPSDKGPTGGASTQ